MTPESKKEFIASFKQDITMHSFVTLVKLEGLSVSLVNKFRNNLRKCGAKARIVKNTLAKISVDDTIHSSISEGFCGPIIAIFGNSPIDIAKAAVDFKKEVEPKKILFNIVCASLDGQFFNAQAVEELSSVPPLDVSRAMLLGVISKSMSNVLTCIKENPSRIVRVLSSKK